MKYRYGKPCFGNFYFATNDERKWYCGYCEMEHQKECQKVYNAKKIAERLLK